MTAKQPAYIYVKPMPASDGTPGVLLQLQHGHILMRTADARHVAARLYEAAHDADHEDYEHPPTFATPGAPPMPLPTGPNWPYEMRRILTERGFTPGQAEEMVNLMMDAIE